MPVLCHPCRAIVIVAAMLAAAGSGEVSAAVSKGQLILIDRGLQVQGMVTRDDVFNLGTYSNANYTSVHWLWTSNPSQLGTAPGFPWSRWAGDEASVPPLTGEAPYMPQLVTLQLGDEWNLNDAAIRTRAVNWFNAIRSNFPNHRLHEQLRGPGERRRAGGLHHPRATRHVVLRHLPVAL